jgi:hypothetical protein
MWISASAQKITWSKDRKLQWSDFKAKITDTVPAASVVGIKFMPVQYRPAIKKALYKATAVFDSNASFHNPRKIDNYLLTHERLHFDIAAMFALRLQQLSSERGYISEREAKMIFTDINTELSAYQEKYDKDTAHGADGDAQRKWTKLVGDQMP